MSELDPALLLAHLENLGPPRAWDPALPSPPWTDPGFSRRLLRAQLAEEGNLAGRRPGLAVAQARWIAAHLTPGATILDLGCGAGLHALEWAAAGHPVTAVDLSPAPLAYLRERAAARALPVTTRQMDLRQLSGSDSYDAVVMLYGLFHTLTPAAGLATLRAIRERLRPDGTLFVELRTSGGWDRRAYRSWLRGEAARLAPEGALGLVVHGWDEAAEAEVEQYLILSPGGRLETFAVTERHVTQAEWERLLAEAGLSALPGGTGWPSERPAEWRLLAAHPPPVH